MARGSWPFGVAVVALAVLSLSRFWPSEEVDFVGQVNRPHARAKVARRRGVKGRERVGNSSKSIVLIIVS